MASKKPTKEAAIAQLWELGELSWKLKGKQKDVYKSLKEDPNDTTCVLISRRFGKSFLNCLLAVETCLKTPGAIVKYACPQQRQVRTIIRPIMREIFRDCPAHLKCEEKKAENVYSFPNGSEIQLAGTDNGNAENLRGGYAHLLICDEAGFMSDLDYIINSILLPTTDTTDGRLVLTSTPNFKDPQHEFHESFVFPLEAESRLIKYTIDDSPMVTPAKIKNIESRYVGGRNNPKFQCEYLCIIPRSSELTVVPEFNGDTKTNMIVTELHKPPFFDPYVSMDVGFKDLTVALFSYYDFKNAELVIVDELVMNGPEMTTDYLADNVRELEKLRFKDNKFEEQIPTFLRIMDNDLKLINDLSRLHDLQFIATAKDNKEAAINNLRMWVQNGRIKIHERCKHLIYHLESGQWDKNRKKFKHLKDSPSGDIRGGHADALDALIYLVRNIVESKNPFPSGYGMLSGSDVVDTGWKRKDSEGTIKSFFDSILNKKKR